MAKLRGAAGTQVRLKIARKDQDKPIDLTIVREVIRGAGARIQVKVVDGTLVVEAIGPWSVLDFEKGKPVAVQPLSGSEFRLESGEHTRLSFTQDRVVLNPGPWQIEGTKLP